MAHDLSGKVAVVTGSSSGIGAATARALTDTGVSVVVNSAHSVEAGRAVADALPGAIYVQADVTDEEAATRLVRNTVEHFGRLDILVNNAGTTTVIPHHDIEAATPEIWRRIFEVNVIGTWQMTVTAMPHLRDSGDGAVVNVSSIAGHAATGSSIPYAVSKAAISHMTQLLANVVGPAVRVNAVAPGLIDTPWTQAWEHWDLMRTAISQMAPLKRVGSPDDVAQVIVDLAGARYVTGEVVLVDGGLRLFR